MRLNKFLIIIFSITLASLIYVHQQSKIVYLAYQEQERLAFLERLIDTKNSLKYNLNRQISLVSIAEILREQDFEWPQSKQLVSLSVTHQDMENNRYTKERESIFTRILGLSSKAEATPIKAR